MASIEQTLRGLEHFSTGGLQTFIDRGENSTVEIVAESASKILALTLETLKNGNEVDPQRLAEYIDEELGEFFPGN